MALVAVFLFLRHYVFLLFVFDGLIFFRMSNPEESGGFTRPELGGMDVMRGWKFSQKQDLRNRGISR